jgi:hypothetical protein
VNNGRLSVRLDEQLEHQLREEARRSGMTESEVVREVLAAHFARSLRPATALQVARRASVIGCAEGLPADLSSNKAYLKGFGSAPAVKP